MLKWRERNFFLSGRRGSERMENLWQNDTGKTNRSLNSIIIKRSDGMSEKTNKFILEARRLTPLTTLESFPWVVWSRAHTHKTFSFSFFGNKTKRTINFPPKSYKSEKSTHQRKYGKNLVCLWQKASLFLFTWKYNFFKRSLSFWDGQRKYVKNVSNLVKRKNKWRVRWSV